MTIVSTKSTVKAVRVFRNQHQNQIHHRPKPTAHTNFEYLCVYCMRHFRSTDEMSRDKPHMYDRIVECMFSTADMFAWYGVSEPLTSTSISLLEARAHRIFVQIGRAVFGTTINKFVYTNVPNPKSALNQFIVYKNTGVRTATMSKVGAVMKSQPGCRIQKPRYSLTRMIG